MNSNARVVEKTISTMNIRVRDAKKGVLSHKSGVNGLYSASESEIAMYGEEKPGETRTLGFRPTCSCDAPAIPATVLDPFCGVGTTNLTAMRLGRRSIGVDLNEDYYLSLASARLASATLPLALGGDA